MYIRLLGKTLDLRRLQMGAARAEEVRADKEKGIPGDT